LGRGWRPFKGLIETVVTMGIRRRVQMVMVAGALAVYGCGGDDQPTPASVPVACDDAFRVEGGALPSAGTAAGEAPAPVALSSCAKGEGGSVAIGGADGCGPNVVVDQTSPGRRPSAGSPSTTAASWSFPTSATRRLEAVEPDHAGIRIESGGLPASAPPPARSVTTPARTLR
jgi:hypothetical protein